MVDKVKEEKIISPLKDVTVMVKPIPKKSGMLFDNTGRTSLPGAKSGFKGLPENPQTLRKIEPLTDSERAWFESKEAGLGFIKGDLVANNPNKPKTYWTRQSIVLRSDETLNLRLSDPGDYLRWAFLKAQIEAVSPTWEERNDKLSYSHALVDTEKMDAERATKSDNVAEAYIFLGEINHSIPKMKAFLASLFKVTKSRKRPPINVTAEWIKGELADAIQNNLREFLQVKNDELLQQKLFLEECIESGVVMRDGKNTYQVPGYPEVYTIVELANEIANVTPASQKLYAKLKVQLETANKK